MKYCISLLQIDKENIYTTTKCNFSLCYHKFTKKRKNDNDSPKPTLLFSKGTCYIIKGFKKCHKCDFLIMEVYYTTCIFKVVECDRE